MPWVRNHTIARPNTISIGDVQTKLNRSRPTGIRDRAETAGEWPRTSWTAHRNEWRSQVGTSDAWHVNMPVEDVEELCTEVDSDLLIKELSLFAKREILIPGSEKASTCQRARLVADWRG